MMAPAVATSILPLFDAARRVSTPLLAIKTLNPASTLAELAARLPENLAAQIDGGVGAPVFSWDAAAGLRPINEPAQAALALLNPEGEALFAVEAKEALRVAALLPKDTVIVFFHLARLLGSEGAGLKLTQALWNLRDAYKSNGSMAVLLGVDFAFPAEIAQDIIVLDEPLPDEAALAEIVQTVYTAAEVKPPKDLTPIVSAIQGLSAFPAEQVLAMSLDVPTGRMDLPALWERTNQVIESHDALKVDRNELALEALGGLAQLKKFGAKLYAGRAPFKVIVRLDEIDKMMAGLGSGGGPGDNTGVTQDQLSVLLRAMEDLDWPGLLLVGPAGSGKTAFSKGLGVTYQRRTLALDLGGAKKKHVGESEASIRAVVKIILALAGRGGALFIGCCNKLDVLPPEMKRRFRLGIWYCDLLSAEERAVIWPLTLKRYGLKESLPRPADEGWTGADIRTCVDNAWRMGCSLIEAAEFVVPVAQSDPESIERLRRSAAGRFLSASAPGAYTIPMKSTTVARKIRA